MAINENYTDVSKYRGPIRACEFCKNAELPEALRVYCKFCLVGGYVAQCLKCDGTGLITGIAPWDNASKHSSTCDICGGDGVLPAKKPIDAEIASPATTMPIVPPVPAAKPESKDDVKVVGTVVKSKEREAVVA